MDTDLIKIGEVSSVNPAEGTARVIFDDDDGLVSYDLQVVHPNTFKNKDYALPDVGTDVVCIFLGSGAEEGFILGGVYTDGNPPPEGSIDVRAVEFADGTVVRYDRAGHVLSVTIGGLTIQADRQQLAINAPQQVTAEAGANVNVKAGAQIALTAPTVTLTMGATTMVLSGSGATIKTSKLKVEGDIECTGDVTAGGISLRNHTHPGDSGGTTGAPS